VGGGLFLGEGEGAVCWCWLLGVEDGLNRVDKITSALPTHSAGYHSL
jgi:hypothetical protein